MRIVGTRRTATNTCNSNNGQHNTHRCHHVRDGDGLLLETAHAGDRRLLHPVPLGPVQGAAGRLAVAAAPLLPVSVRDAAAPGRAALPEDGRRQHRVDGARVPAGECQRYAMICNGVCVCFDESV